jgi:preprotein translocase subunit SecG
MLHTTLMVVHFFTAVSIVLLVLLQRGKGADAGAGFGAGASGTVFGARGAGTALSRTTAILAVVFMITSLSLTYVGSRTAAPPSTVLERLSQQPKSPPVSSAPAPSSAGAPTAAGSAAPATPAAPTKPAQ